MNQAERQRYEARRQATMAQMGARSLGVWMTPPELEQRPDVMMPFVQQADILYLTGSALPESVLVLRNDGEQQRSTLFIQERDPIHEQWEGERPSPQPLQAALGIDEVLTLDALEARMQEWCPQSERVYYQAGQWREQDTRLHHWVHQAQRKTSRGSVIPQSVIATKGLVGALRQMKDEDEARRLRRAAAITVEGFQRAMQSAKAGTWAYELEAELQYTYLKHGGQQAFKSVIASGHRATILHYRDHQHQLAAGELVLLDGGAQWQGYASDCSRVVPVDGRFTEAQAALYDLVLEAQRAALARCRPGHRFADVEAAAREIIEEGLVTLGILPEQGDPARNVETYFPHRIGHWLGLDVHDPGTYTEADGSSLRLQAGMCFTVEPGVYIPRDDQSVPAQYRGIGIRIEDPVLITEDEPEVLTADCPKERFALEALLTS